MTTKRPYRYQWERAFRKADDPALTGTVKATGYALATYANTDGSNARPSLATLVIASGASDRAVRHGLQVLRARGWIERTETFVNRPGRPPDVYRLTMPGTVAAVSSNVHDGAPALLPGNGGK